MNIRINTEFMKGNIESRSSGESQAREPLKQITRMNNIDRGSKALYRALSQPISVSLTKSLNFLKLRQNIIYFLELRQNVILIVGMLIFCLLYHCTMDMLKYKVQTCCQDDVHTSFVILAQFKLVASTLPFCGNIDVL